MKIRTSIAAAGAAAVLAGAGAIMLPAVASAHSTTHTLKFTAVTVTPQTFFSKTSSGQAEKDVNSTGKVIGYDVVNVEFNPATGTASGGVTLSTNGGFLYGALKFTSTSPLVHGTVTGGTGAFKGATGTITGKQNQVGNRTAVTITYTTP
jgi:hypothetical protein